jgi:hypothetical protein
MQRYVMCVLATAKALMVREAIKMRDKFRGKAASSLAQNRSSKSSECGEVHSVKDHKGKQAFSVHGTHSHPTLHPTPSRFPFFSVSKVYLDLKALQAKAGLMPSRAIMGPNTPHTFV